MRQLDFEGIETQRDFGSTPGATTSYRELAVTPGRSNVLPILSRLSHNGDARWLTCVNSPTVDKRTAREADIEANKILNVRTPKRGNAMEVIKKALASGRSHTVVGFCSNLTVGQRRELRQCAEIANCQCLVLTPGA